MVAIRQTHEASFDFAKWSEELNLPEAKRIELLGAHDFVVKHISDKDKRESSEHIDAVVASFTRMSTEIVAILLTLNMDLPSLMVAVLYPAYENAYITTQDVEAKYGQNLAKLLLNVKDMEAIRSLQTLTSDKASEEQVDRIRRMLLAMVEDVRAVVIKLAERIAYIRAAKDADEETRVLIAKEVANVYAPLANRLGIGQLKWELEDLAFRFLHPDIYKEIAHELDERRVDREKYIENFVGELRELLAKEGIKAEVYGRPKHIYSIYRKMQRKHLQFSELYDVRAVRILVERIQDCYAALGVVHTRWHHIPKEFDDYVANPKANGYQSIHTVVYGDGGKVVEIQIRTEDMHNSAELGVAAHWKYKEGSGQSSGVEQRINWLRKLLTWRDDMVESGALLDEFRTQVFEDRIYVFTPRGEVIDLPTGSTPLDFAYHVHTMVGHRCIGAKVDGRIVPYTYKLKTGQQVEIITQKNPNPSRDWLNADNGFLKTSKARAKVQSYFRKLDYEKNQQAGEEIIDREVLKHGLSLNKDQTVSVLKDKLSRFNVKSVPDLQAAVGAGDISINSVISVLDEVAIKEKREEEQADLSKIISNRSASEIMQAKGRKQSQVVVNGVGNLMTHIAKCCQPIPGDEILGFITQGRGISIHRCDCEQLKKLAEQSPERLVDATWGENSDGGYTVTIRVTGQDYPGLLRDVTTIIANEKMNVLGVRSHVDRSIDVSIIDIDLLVLSIPVLTRTLTKLNELPKVISAKRR